MAGLYHVLALGWQSAPKMGVVRVTWPTFKFCGRYRIFETVAARNFKYGVGLCRLIVTCMTDYCRKRRVEDHVTSFIFDKIISDNISKTVQRTDIVTMEDNSSSLYQLQKHPLLPPFCAALAQGAEILTREIWVRPVKFHLDPFRFAGVIREKPILSKHTLRYSAWH